MEALKDQWAKGLFNGGRLEDNALKNSAAQAQVEILERMLKVTHEDINEALNDEE